MLRGALTGVKRLVLWDYPRATWQYDVMVGLILAFVFLTPPSWFRDQPRMPRASRIARLPGARGTDVFWIESGLLGDAPPAELKAKAGRLLKRQDGTTGAIIRLEPVYDSENALKGYLAFTGH